jgi:uncharacterized membrane protein YesL
MSIFRVLWLSLKDVFDELFTLMAVNLIWVVMSAPLIIVAVFLLGAGSTVLGIIVALLAVLPLAPANAGLYTIAQRVSEGRVIAWRLFFEGFREYLRLSWQVYGLWAIGLFLIIGNFSFYGGIASGLGTFVRILLLYLLVVWFGLLIYIGPLMVLQTDKRLRVIARNAFVMVFGRPIFTLVTLLLMALLGVVLGTFVPLLPLLLTFSFLAIWGFRATSALVADAEARRAAQEERTAAAASNSLNTDKGRGGQVRPRD